MSPESTVKKQHTILKSFVVETQLTFLVTVTSLKLTIANRKTLELKLDRGVSTYCSALGTHVVVFLVLFVRL